MSTGETVPLRSLYEDQRLMLIFLRHLGCVFCKDHVAQLRNLSDLNIVFVTLGTPEQTEEFRKKMKSPHRFISDPDKTLHNLFSLQQGGMAQLFNPHTISRALTLLAQGHFQGLKPQQDVKQLPGVFLVEQDGTITWEYRARDAADNPPPDQIRARLRPGQSEA